MKNTIMQMNNVTKMLLSLLIGLVGAGVAKLVHPAWSMTYLSIFGFSVFAITFIISLVVKRAKHRKD